MGKHFLLNYLRKWAKYNCKYDDITLQEQKWPTVALKFCTRRLIIYHSTKIFCITYTNVCSFTHFLLNTVLLCKNKLCLSDFQTAIHSFFSVSSFESLYFFKEKCFHLLVRMHKFQNFTFLKTTLPCLHGHAK